MSKSNETLPLCSIVFILSILAAGGAFAQPSQSAPTQQKAQAQKGARAVDTRPALSLSEYLGQVSEKHLGYRAGDQTAKAAKLQAGEGSLLFKPTFTAQATNSADVNNSPLSGSDHNIYKSYSLGISQQTNFGLTGKLSYNVLGFELANPAPSYNAGFANLELSQSLLRNFGGGESRAQRDLLEAGALAKSFSQSYLTKTVLLEAESNFWRLALAREMVVMQKDAVDRAQRIYDWTSRRVRLQLADRAEVLQASTNLQARKLDQRTAEDDERAAAQAFNSSRGMLSNEVGERLPVLEPETIVTFTAPVRSVQRDDVKAAEFQAKTSAASANAARERNKPTLDIFGATALNDPGAPPTALSAAIPQSARASTLIGLRATVPLDFGTTAKAREGYAAEAQAADWQYQRKVFEEERDWQDLTAKFQQAKDRLKLYADLEKQQREKLDYERDRQTRGRSTLQQVLLYETDYEVAQLGRIRTLADLLTLNAQMKLYGVSYESR